TSALSFNNPPKAWNGFNYRCKVDNLSSSIFGLSVAGPESYAINITGSDSVTCYNTPVTFNATTTDTTNNYSIDWLINGNNANASGPSFTTQALQDSDKVQALLSITNACGTFSDISRVIKMNVTEVHDSITISTPSTTVCTGTPTVFTAKTVNAGPSPTY